MAHPLRDDQARRRAGDRQRHRHDGGRGGRRAPDRRVGAWNHRHRRGLRALADGKPFANVPALPELLREGWAYVAADYVGLGTRGPHAYLVGEEAARSVLDAVRAARGMADLRSDGRVVVWGHSQGGNSALWAGQRAKELAPELDVLGVGAFAPASDLKALVAAAQGTMFGKIVTAYLVHAFASVYPEFDGAALSRPGTRLLARDIASRCVGEWPTLVSVAQTLLSPPDGFLAAGPARVRLDARLEQNTPRGPFPMPVFLAQGATDDLVPPDIQRSYVMRLCRERQPTTYKTYPGRDHIGLVAEDSPLAPDLIAWTRARFEGKPISPRCGEPP